MNQFYVSLIFIGITLILASLGWILYDRKKSYENIRLLEQKKTELLETVKDAEEMIDEMNKFSDYIVTQMELKNDEIRTNLKYFDTKINEIRSRAENSLVSTEHNTSKADDGMDSGNIRIGENPVQENKCDLIIENLPDLYENRVKPAAKKNDKIIPLNSRYRDVVKLAENGLSDVEIAKRLNMGKGEIQLVREINR
jgi:DNA-binding NarL/FixJ family response regulator